MAEAQPLFPQSLHPTQTGSIANHHFHNATPTASLGRKHASATIRRKPVPGSKKPFGEESVKPTSIIKSWYFETLSLLLAFVALAAIIIVLVTQSGKPLPKWPRLITINSLVAIFTAILKAAMMVPVVEALGELKWLWYGQPRPVNDIEYFDAASRGPWGALELIVKLPRAIIPALGAVITICALAVDPFTQQILQYRPCLINGTQVAQIPRSTNYSTSGPNPNDAGYILDGPMTSAIYQGLYNPPINLTSALAISCSSGNCTFPNNDGISYHTLGLCVNMQDISNLISGLDNIESDPLDWNFTLPSGLQTSGPTSDGVVMTVQTITSPSESDGIDEWHVPLHEFEGLAVLMPNSGPVVPWAFRSRLYPCITGYGNTNISSSVLQSQAFSSTNLASSQTSEYESYFSLAGDFASHPGVDCSPSPSPEGNKTVATVLLPDGRAIGPGTATTLYGELPYSLRNETKAYYDPGCVYAFGYGPTDSMSSFSTSLFGQKATTSGGVPVNLTWEGDTPQVLAGPLWLQNIYANATANLTSVTKVMQDFANALSVHVSDAGEGSPLIGTTLIEQTCLNVRWGWLALDAALVVLAAVFFGMAVWQSRQAVVAGRDSKSPDRQKTGANMRVGFSTTIRGPWKSSCLPLLWSGVVEDQDSPNHKGSWTLQQIEARGKGRRVVLGERPDGAGFCLKEE